LKFASFRIALLDAIAAPSVCWREATSAALSAATLTSMLQGNAMMQGNVDKHRIGNASPDTSGMLTS